MYDIKIWTDGSCDNGTGKGAWCSIIAAMREDVTEDDIETLVYTVSQSLSKTRTELVSRDSKLRAKVAILRGYQEGTTSNRMELMAIIEAIRSMKTPCKLTLTSDSTYAIKVLSGENEARCNLDLLEEWQKVSGGFEIEFCHVRGHSDNKLNKWCDEIAGHTRSQKSANS